jgi:hypothetical protein
VWGISNRHTTDFHKKFVTFLVVMAASASDSTHLVK